MAEKENKKRKRRSNGIESSNKKVAFAAPSNSRPIEVSFNDATGLHPVLISSPGLTTPRISFNAYAKPRSTKQPNNDARKPDSHSLLLQSSQHPRLDYIATLNGLDQNLSHYIAVFDPASNELQIIPAHHLSLRATLRSGIEEQDHKPQRTIGQQREELGREFGTKKAKKALDARTVNALAGRGSGDKQKTSTDVQTAILDSMAAPAGAEALGKEEALEAALASKPIPKPNLAAATVEAVYPLNTLIPVQDMKLVPIKEWQEQMQQEGEQKTTASRLYPADRAAALAKREDIVRLKALSYLNLLLDFNAVLVAAGKVGKKVPKKDIMDRRLANWPEALVSSVRHRFANSSNELPKWHLERLYTHACALALYIDGYVTDTQLLKEDLQLEQREIVQYFRELGCKVSPPTDKERETRGLSKAHASLVKIAKLKLPLDFPKPRSGRRR